MWLKHFILFATLTVLCNGTKDTSCNFGSWSTMCGWYVNDNYYTTCHWSLKSLNSNSGYIYLKGAPRCSSSIEWQFGTFDGSADNYLTIEYHVKGPGPFTLKVLYGYSSANTIAWSCAIQSGDMKRKAYVYVPGSEYYISITGKVGKGSYLIIDRIWGDLQGHTSSQRQCPRLPTTPRPTTPRPTTITTTPRPTTTTSRPTTITTTPRPTTTTPRPTTITTTPRPTTTTPRPTTTTPRPTTITTTPRPTTTTPRPTTTTPKLTTVTTMRPTTATTSRTIKKNLSTAKSLKRTTSFTTPKRISTINISKSTEQKTITTTTKANSQGQTTKTVWPTTIRNTRIPSFSAVTSLQSAFPSGLTSSTTAGLSKNDSSVVLSSISSHSSTWTANPLTNKATTTINRNVSGISEVNPTLSTINSQTKRLTGGIISTGIPNTQRTSPSVTSIRMETGSILESTTHNGRMGKNSAEIGKEKTKKIIIAGVVGILGLIIIITIVIIVKKRRKENAQPFYDQPSKTESVVAFENKAYA